ncbi:MAG: restriction endonuclease subunit S, partial [Pyrinomonadaceae bacterium]
MNESQEFAVPSAKSTLTGGARFENRDTLFSRITPCLENGKICQVKNLENGKGFGSTEFLVFRGKENVSINDFVYYLSRFNEVRSFAEKNMSGTSGRQRVNKDAFANLELELPPIEEQKEIAEILSSLDDKIELNWQMNATLEAMARAMFKAWFVDFEPVRANMENRPSESASPEI